MKGAATREPRKPGRRRIATHEMIAIIDEWMRKAEGRRNKKPPAKTLAGKLGISEKTVMDVAHRARAYAKLFWSL
jgi:hypothetical protein